MRQSLTDLTIRSLPHPESGDVKYWDKTTPGFGVRVTARTKSFFVVRGKARQLTTIGRYPEISLQDARKEAKRLLVQEPAEKRPMKLVEAVEAFLADCATRLRPNSVRAYQVVLKSCPDVRLSELTRKQVDTTNPHITKAYKALYNWCLKEELVDRNPFQHSQVVFKTRSRVLSDDEIKAIWQYDYPPYSHIIKLCLLTGQRVGEVCQFNPDWIVADTITIPATVAKNGKEHVFPFQLLTAKYLKEYQYQTFNGHSKGKARLDKHHPLPHWTVHDLRRTFSTIHARLGTPLHVTERLLNHVSGTISGVSAIYNRHNYLAEMRKAVVVYESHIAQLVGE